MKSLQLFISALAILVFTVAANAQEHIHVKANTLQDTLKAESFKVWGKCDMCKARIEKTAISAGAEEATWEAKTQMLKVIYNPATTGKEAISKKLAAAGHDTEKHKATDEVYDKLPACCHYDRSK
jgi:hypothetical protein